MSRFLIPFILTAAIIGGGIVLFQDRLPFTSSTVQKAVIEQKDGLEQKLSPAPQSTPEPLRGPREDNEAVLTIEGVFTATNQERANEGKKVLIHNTTLDQAAANKAKDILEKQYFDHVSPSGLGPSDVVTNVGYAYITVGENLALGNFDSDNDLVAAWMNSPGHRANILSDAFTEIGISVMQGTFEDEKTWVAVQTFATPTSVCTVPDHDQETQIMTNQTTLNQMKTTLDTTKPDANQETQQQIDEKITRGNELIAEGNTKIKEGNELAKQGDQDGAEKNWAEGKSLQEQGQKLIDEANALISELQAKQKAYNQVVTDYNALLKKTQTLINQYNETVKAFNTCAQVYIDATEEHH